MPKLITSYIFKEMLTPFLLCTALLTITALLGKLIKLIELVLTQNAGAANTMWLALSLIPSSLIYTIPASFLVGVLIACTRLSSDSEIIAMKSAGLGLATVMKPAFVLAIVSCVLTLLVSMYLAPWGKYNFQKTLFTMARTKAAAGIEQRTFHDKFGDIVLYVDHIPPRADVLKGVFISDRSSGTERIIVAEKGVFLPNREGRGLAFRLENGTIHRAGLSANKEEAYHHLKFSDYTVELGAAAGGVEDRAKWYKELYTGELIQRINQLKEEGRSTVRPLILLHKRFASAFVVFAFMLLGVPLGMQRVRSGRTAGFGLAIGVLLAYYITTKIFETLAYEQSLSPAVGVWGSVVVLGAAGLYVFYMATGERQPISVNRLEELVIRLGRRFGRITGK